MLLPAEDGCDVMISHNRRSLVWVDGEGGRVPQRPPVLLHVQIQSHMHSRPFVQKLQSLFVTLSIN